MSPSVIHKPGALFHIAPENIPDASGKVILVTGGASGIGLAAVKLFEEKNATGVVAADFKKPPNDVLVAFSKNTIFAQTDVTSWKSLCDAFQSTIDRFGRLDYVFANAGIGEVDHLFVNKIDEVTGQPQEPNYAAVDVNLKGVLNTVKLAVYWFRKQNIQGSIVMTSSMSGYETPGIPIYVSSKHGVIGVLRAASLDLYDEYKIKLNVVAPGPVLSNLIDSFAKRKPTKHDDADAEYEWETQKADKPALAAAYLLSNPDYGRSILVHGGRYRDAEEGYNAMRDEILGGELGIPPATEQGWRNLFRCAFE